MAFLRTVLNSIYSPAFYEKAWQRPPGSALGYFALLVLVCSVLRVAIQVGPVAVEIGATLRSGIAELVSLYPPELRISIEDGQASSNVREPYAIPLPEWIDDEPEIRSILVIDTQTPFSAAQFSRYRTLAWLTRDALFVGGGANSTRTLDLAEVGSVEIDREGVDAAARAVEPYLGLVGPLIAILAFAYFLVSGAFRLVYLLLLALLVWVIARALGRRAGYGAAYRLGVYAMTLPLLVELVLDLTGPWLHLSGFPFMFSALTLAVVAVNLLPGARRQSPTLGPEPA